jgi:hypothetical protein
MRLILVVLLFIPLLAISCIDKEFEKELNFIKIIKDNPNNITSVISASEFYDTTYFNFKKRNLSTIISYLESRKGELSIDCNYKTITIDNDTYKDAKIVSINEDKMDDSLMFIFIKVNNEIKLIDIFILVKNLY